MDGISHLPVNLRNLFFKLIVITHTRHNQLFLMQLLNLLNL